MKIGKRNTEKIKSYRGIVFLAIVVIVLSLLHVLYQNSLDKEKQKYANIQGKTMAATVQTIHTFSD
jgi:hypothetical protein